MNYLNSYQISKIWNISQCRIIKLAREGRIEGAKRLGRNWMIPENAIKPIDGRTKISKQIIYKDDFRYPCFAFQDPSNINPSLSEEELIIKKVQELIFACDFFEASKVLATLPKETENVYCHIYGLYEACMINACTKNTKDFVNTYQKLYLEIFNLPSHRHEMEYLIYEIDASIGNDRYFMGDFISGYNQTYHKSFLPHFTVLNAVSLFYQSDKINVSTIKAIEIACEFMEDTGNITDLQSTYFYLGNIFYAINKYDKMKYYYSKAFDIALKYNSIYDVCSQYHYLKEAFDSVLVDYPIELQTKIKQLSNTLHSSYTVLSNELSLNTIYRLLPSNYYPLLLYAVHGYTIKEIANMLKLSEATINKKFSEMYDLTNVRNKNELINLYKKEVNLSVLKKPNI